MENTHTFTKSNTPPWVFSLFKSCINATKSRNSSHMIAISFYRLCFQYCSEGPERLLNVLYMFSLNPDSRGEFIREVAVRGCLKKLLERYCRVFMTTCSFLIKPLTISKNTATMRLSLGTVGIFSAWLFSRKFLSGCLSHEHDS